MMTHKTRCRRQQKTSSCSSIHQFSVSWFRSQRHTRILINIVPMMIFAIKIGDENLFDLCCCCLDTFTTRRENRLNWFCFCNSSLRLVQSTCGQCDAQLYCCSRFCKANCCCLIDFRFSNAAAICDFKWNHRTKRDRDQLKCCAIDAVLSASRRSLFSFTSCGYEMKFFDESTHGPMPSQLINGISEEREKPSLGLHVGDRFYNIDSHVEALL